MHERTNVQLSVADRRELEAVVANRNSPQKHVWGAKIMLLTADGRGTAEIMRATTARWALLCARRKTRIGNWQSNDDQR